MPSSTKLFTILFLSLLGAGCGTYARVVKNVPYEGSQPKLTTTESNVGMGGQGLPPDQRHTQKVVQYHEIALAANRVGGMVEQVAIDMLRAQELDETPNKGMTIRLLTEEEWQNPPRVVGGSWSEKSAYLALDGANMVRAHTTFYIEVNRDGAYIHCP